METRPAIVYGRSVVVVGYGGQSKGRERNSIKRPSCNINTYIEREYIKINWQGS